MKTRFIKLHIVLEFLSVFFLVGTCVYIFLIWDNIPDRIPLHYNFAGEINRWGNKHSLLFLPIVNFLIYLLLTVVLFFPSSWNISVEVTKENKNQIYHLVKSMLLFLKLLISLTFSFITLVSVSLKPMPLLFLPILFFFLFGIIIYFNRKIKKISKIPKSKPTIY